MHAVPKRRSAQGEEMKNKRLMAVLLIGALVLLGAVAAAYATTSVRPGEAPAVVFAGQEVQPGESVFAEPVLGGLLTKRIVQESTDPAGDLGVLTVATLPLEVDAHGEEPSSGSTEVREDVWVTLWLDGQHVFSGTPEEYAEFRFSENGPYRAALKIERPEDGQTSRAVFNYEISFELDVQPVVLFSSDRARQGDILSVYVNRGFATEAPEVETALGTAIFLPLSSDEYISYIPVNYAQTLGKWMIDVSVGGEAYEQGIIVTGRTYKEQHMTISQSTTDATMNNPDGPKNWAERIKVLWETYDVKKYWDEVFIRPCDGRISTEFGLYRYTNNNPVPTRHTGIDIAAPAGTPILASNSGRVVRAEEIIYTGNTVVIEHGGGLKTYYFHMETMDVKEGDLIERGTVLGTVGSTGYSTGAHLHFEVKIGSHSLSPWELFDGTSELYFDVGF